jgi:molybdenum cofactor guanylyltransferase
MPRNDAPGPVAAPRVWHGAVLAGGAARRFGSDKVFAVVTGARLIDRALASLTSAASVSAVLGPPERLAATLAALPEGVTALADDLPGRGPMGGLATVLARRPDGWTALLAADMPLVPTEWWRRLADQHRPGAVALVPRGGDGRWEPLAALYHGSLADEVRAAVESDEPERLGFQSWLGSLEREGRAVAVGLESLPAGVLTNVNRPGDLAVVEAELAANDAQR